MYYKLTTVTFQQPLSILFLLEGMSNQLCPGNHKHLATPLAITEEATTPDNSQN